ncbi:serine/threonine-protein kinase [Microbacterium sp. cf332]|uniref:serine/threonine-protein kinase n=1 Tax=Microbacterium sp. cf332 TaxID=1761804 RepID=UPI0008828975|nr:serine/threonine-protein kinase [Microbacterium sp. cf332]SDQ85061.1 Serine/threonine protein kinase [Microbacterium sp. cf332]
MNDGVTNEDAVMSGALLAGRYRVVEPIGSGGMARVYLARDEALGRPVAVKVLRTEVADGAAADRAAIETRLLASLNHPGLVTLFDAHLSGDPRFLVMEHVVGTTLSHRIMTGALDERELASLGAQLADALHVVHDAGIVHRDVKPSNILLTRSTTPGVPLRAKLADFGIAHLLDSERVTSPSLMVGTAAYIAPEILHGAAPAPPSDIYALGLVLVEAASGSRPFAAAEGNRGQLLARLSRDPDMPMTLDHHWRDLLCAMTSRRPEDRPTAHEVMARIGENGVGVASGGIPVVPASAGAEAQTENARRVALASMATAAWPVADATGITGPAGEPSVTVATPLGRDDTGTGTTQIGPVLASAGVSATRRGADRRRRRRRTAIAVGAASAGAIGAVLAAHLMLTAPEIDPTTDIATVETPAVAPSDTVAPTDETVTTDTTDAGTGTDGTVDTQTVIAPEDAATDPIDTVPVVDTVPAPEGVTPVEDRKTDKGSTARDADGNGNGPGQNSGSGPETNSGNGNGNGLGQNSGTGNGAKDKAPAKPDKASQRDR